ncbi:FAD-dependent oxidoreductase [Flavobacterium akiainvivens]|uniref:FAD-dependent oxidoreductase n=1 Tax=Flavobacterium akiainvivens TaxID=1202724 RepID=A0A0M8ME84_9FLAO|nr:FAD-binding oxidoreductase [Flavobacterium akiainvivens]KOS08415.1 FAD-dependent oxidoreductase [Flavobacterium akiainvivens]
MKDYIIVGGGLAGICFAEIALQAGKAVVLITDDSQNSSTVAAGVYNPVVLKRLNITQDAQEHMDYMAPFYKQVEERIGVVFNNPVPVYRRFAGVEEQNNWFAAADKPSLTAFLSTQIIHKQFEGVDAPYGFGEVLHTGFMDTTRLLNGYLSYLKKEESLLQETFIHADLQIHDGFVSYRGINAKHIVFAEGYGIKANPYFNQLPLNGTKGEILIIKAPGLDINFIAKGSVFVLPFGDGIFKVGATYEWDDKTTIPTAAARAELVEKLEELITCPYEVIGQLAGIRPTVKDRKALVGTHPQYKNIHLLNGLGTRGVILGPPMAKMLFDQIENNIPVKKEVDLNRFSA